MATRRGRPDGAPAFHERAGATRASGERGAYRGAAPEYAALLEREPALGPAWAQYTWVLHQLGRGSDAADAYRRARTFFPAGVDHVEDGWLMSTMRAVEGDEAVNGLIQHWLAESRQRYVDPYNLAGFAVAAGDESAALTHLTRAFDERSPSIFFMNAEPLLAPLRQRAEYRAIVRAMGLGEASRVN